MENKKKEIKQRACVYSKAIDIDLDYQENLEPYNDEMMKILRSSVYNSLVNFDYNNGVLTVHGKSKINITYFNSNDKNLSTAEFDEDFEKNITIDGDYENLSFNIRICDKYNNARIINPTRVDIHNSFSLDIRAYEDRVIPVLAKQDKLLMREQNICTVSQIASSYVKSEFDEEAVISADSSSVNKIINVFTSTALEETKIVENKMLVKAKVGVSALYLADDNSINRIEHISSVNSILDMQGISEGDYDFVNLKIGGIYLKPKADKNNEYRSIEIIGELFVNAIVYRENEFVLPVDAYSVENEADVEYNKVELNSKCRLNSYTLNTKFSLNTDKQIISEVLDLTVQQGFDNSVEITAFISDENGSIYAVNSRHRLDLPQAEEISLSIVSFDYVIVSDNEIEVRLNLNYKALEFTPESLNVINDIKILNSEPSQTPALAVYFADSGEELWNIAKKFKTSVELIKKENELNKDIVDVKRVLIIPGM